MAKMYNHSSLRGSEIKNGGLKEEIGGVNKSARDSLPTSFYIASST